MLQSTDYASQDKQMETQNLTNVSWEVLSNKVFNRISNLYCLRVPWRARRSNQSSPKELNPEYSLMLKLNLIQTADSLEKILILGKTVGRRRRGWEDEMVGWHHQLNGQVWANSGTWWKTGKPDILQSMWSQRVEHNWDKNKWFVEQQRKISDSKVVNSCFHLYGGNQPCS